MAARDLSAPDVPSPASSDGPIHVLVAGVPYSYPHAYPDGRWLTPRHEAAIRAVSPRIELVHSTRAELEAGARPPFPPEVILTETTGTATELDNSEWVEHLVRGRDLVETFSPALHWVQSCSHGTEKVFPMLPASVPLVRADVHAPGVAESVFAAILLHSKRLLDRVEAKSNHAWELLEYRELLGATMVVLGAGGLGQGVARIARAFGMHVIGVRRNPQPVDVFDETVGPEDLERVLPRADFLVVTLPKTKQTVGMIAAPQLAMLPDGAFVVNVGRGEVMDEGHLLAALRTGQVAGAYLDVFVAEPLPADSPLWDAPNTIITPHDAHRSDSVADRVVASFCANLQRYLAGEPLVGVADRNAGY